jgi:hypothetical protein
MIPIGEPGGALQIDPASSGGNELGKRYTNESGHLEVLVTKAGSGTLADGSKPLRVKPPNPLPSSD